MEWALVNTGQKKMCNKTLPFLLQCYIQSISSFNNQWTFSNGWKKNNGRTIFFIFLVFCCRFAHFSRLTLFSPFLVLVTFRFLYAYSICFFLLCNGDVNFDGGDAADEPFKCLHSYEHSITTINTRIFCYT